MPRTYQKLFTQQTTLTHVNGKPLWLGMTIQEDDAWTFGFALLVFEVWNALPPGALLSAAANVLLSLVSSHPIGIYAWVYAFPEAFFLTWVSRRINPDGKKLPRYLMDALWYFVRPHASDGFQSLSRRLTRPQGRRVRMPHSAQVGWTQTDVPLPARIVGSGEVWVKTPVVVQRAKHDPGWRVRAPRRGDVMVRPGLYQVGKGARWTLVPDERKIP